MKCSERDIGLNNDKELEKINKEIENDLLRYEISSSNTTDKKQFLSVKFICTFILVINMLLSAFNIFI